MRNLSYFRTGSVHGASGASRGRRRAESRPKIPDPNLSSRPLQCLVRYRQSWDPGIPGTQLCPRPAGPGVHLGTRERQRRLANTNREWHSDKETQIYSMLRNSASGPETGLPGRILAGLLPGKHRHRPSGRPEGLFRCVPGSSPAEIWPGRPPISGPKALLRNIEYLYVYLLLWTLNGQALRIYKWSMSSPLLARGRDFPHGFGFALGYGRHLAAAVSKAKPKRNQIRPGNPVRRPGPAHQGLGVGHR